MNKTKFCDKCLKDVVPIFRGGLDADGDAKYEKICPDCGNIIDED